MKRILAVLPFLLLTVACSTSASAPKAQDPPKSETLFAPNTATLAQQKMCAEQAAKRFDEDVDARNKNLASYTSHYDPAVNVCYVRIDQTLVTGRVLSTSSTLSDAFEGRIYGTYLWSNPKQKKYWEVAPLKCHINIPGKPTIACRSDEQFDQLAEKYFGISK